MIIKDKKIFQAIIGTLIVLLAYIAYSIYFDVFLRGKIILISFIIVLFVQLIISQFVRFTYKKLLKYNSVLFTVFTLYVFCATLFYFLMIIVIKNLKYLYLL